MLEKINSFVWGKTLILLILTVGVFYTVRLRAVQLKMLPYFCRKFRKNRKIGPQFRTLCMSLGTAMGTGNITGVASAIAAGGAGAVFWMWVSAFFGMATVYAENTLSAAYSGKHIHGSVAYIEKGVGSKALAVFFSVCCILACFGMGGMIQMNALSESVSECTHISHFWLAAALFCALFLTISGGAGRIGSAAQLLLPAATVIYSAVCIFVIVRFRTALPEALGRIFREAFGIRQAAGGISGYMISRAVSAGIRRGVFSNEAGLGSSPILHSSSEKASSGELQGMCSMLEVFIDTMLCCTLTAVVILCASEDMTIRSAFFRVLPSYADTLLACVMAVFAFCTAIGWYFCGETAFIYLFGRSRTIIFAFSFALISACGALLRAEPVWLISDIFNGLMAFPNLFALLFLMKNVRSE